MTGKKEVLSLVKAMYDVFEKHGYEAVMKKLSELDGPSLSDLDDRLKTSIIKLTCKSYGISASDLKRKSLRGKEKTARTMCFILLKRHLPNQSYIQLASLFGNKSHSLVSSSLKEFAQMSSDKDPNPKFIKRYLKLNDQVIELKELKLKKQQHADD